MTLVVIMGPFGTNSKAVARVKDSFRKAVHRSTATIAPQADLCIVRSAAIDAGDDTSLRTTALLTASGSTADADHGRELRPIDRVEMAVFGAGRHGAATLAWPEK